MVFEIPEEVNVYDLIALAVIEQAAQDAVSENPVIAKEAKDWLAGEGCLWWDVLGLEDELYNQLTGKLTGGSTN